MDIFKQPVGSVPSFDIYFEPKIKIHFSRKCKKIDLDLAFQDNGLIRM